MDFSTPLWTDHYTIVVPLRTKDNLLLFLYSFSYEVWVAMFISIPIVMLAMLSAECIYSNTFSWKKSIGFVLRIALLDVSCKKPEKNISPALALTWMFAMFCLASGYAGNLKAILAKPPLEKTIKNAADLANQAEIPWVVLQGDDFYKYATKLTKGSTMRTLSDKAQYMNADDEWYGKCFTSETKNADKYASVCQGMGVRDLLARDFSSTGTCNYYTTEDTFLNAPQSMLLQVSRLFSANKHILLYKLSHNNFQFQKGSPLKDDLNRLIIMAQQMGFMDSLFVKNVANSTKCTTWKQVAESHMTRNQDVGIRLKDLGGMLILLVFGLSSSLLMFIAENIMHWCWNEVVHS